MTYIKIISWWRHQMKTMSALLDLCVGNSPVTGEFPSQRPVTRSFDVFFDLRLNKRLSKQSWGWWFETPSCPCDATVMILGWLTSSYLTSTRYMQLLLSRSIITRLGCDWHKLMMSYISIAYKCPKAMASAEKASDCCEIVLFFSQHSPRNINTLHDFISW